MVNFPDVSSLPRDEVSLTVIILANLFIVLVLSQHTVNLNNILFCTVISIKICLSLIRQKLGSPLSIQFFLSALVTKFAFLICSQQISDQRNQLADSQPLQASMCTLRSLQPLVPALVKNVPPYSKSSFSTGCCYWTVIETAISPVVPSTENFNTFCGTIYLYVVPSFDLCVLMRHLFRQQGITTCLVDVASHLVKTFIHQVWP